MPMDPLDPYAQLVMKAPPSPNYIPGPKAPPSPDYIPGPEYPDPGLLIPMQPILGVLQFGIKSQVMSSNSHATITYASMSSYEVTVNGYFGMPMDPLDPYAQLVMKAPPSPNYIPGPKAPPSPDNIPGPEYPEGDNDADDDGDDLSEDDADEEESSDSEEEEEEHQALT
nr:hypothetical protein [Tanacetum cinerariifolium]